MSLLDDLKNNADEIAEGYEQFKKLIGREGTDDAMYEATIPKGVKSIGDYAFYRYRYPAYYNFPDSLETIGRYAFGYSFWLTVVDLNKNIRVVGDLAFAECTHLSTINIGNKLESFGDMTFYNCSGLTKITWESGFNATGLNLSYSRNIKAQSLVDMVNALADRTGETAYTITLGSTNLNKLTAEQIAIATDKNWNLA